MGLRPDVVWRLFEKRKSHILSLGVIDIRHHLSSNRNKTIRCPSTAQQLVLGWHVTTSHPSSQKRGIHTHTSYIKWKWQANEEGEVEPAFPWQVTKCTNEKKQQPKKLMNRDQMIEATFWIISHQNIISRWMATCFSEFLLSVGFEHSEMTLSRLPCSLRRAPKQRQCSGVKIA